MVVEMEVAMEVVARAVVTCDLLCTMVLPSPESTIRASEVANQASGASGGGRAQLLGRSTSHTARSAAFDPKREEQRARVERRPPRGPRPLLGTSAILRNSQPQ